VRFDFNYVIFCERHIFIANGYFFVNNARTCTIACLHDSKQMIRQIIRAYIERSLDIISSRKIIAKIQSAPISYLKGFLLLNIINSVIASISFCNS